MFEQFACKYCGKRYKHYHAFFNHTCREQQRLFETKTPIGQLAFLCYEMWVIKHRRIPPTIECFMTSRFYNTFVEFARFSKRVQLPRIDLFIKVMVRKHFPPALWMLNSVYVDYIQYLDYHLPPIEQVSYSVVTVEDISYQIGVDTCDFFKYITVEEVIDLVRARRLTPWFLLGSSKFKEFLNSKHLTIDQQVMLETVIQPQYWAARINSAPETFEQVKMITQAMGL